MPERSNSGEGRQENAASKISSAHLNGNEGHVRLDFNLYVHTLNSSLIRCKKKSPLVTGEKIIFTSFSPRHLCKS
jgi:hypothetical protein